MTAPLGRCLPDDGENSFSVGQAASSLDYSFVDGKTVCVIHDQDRPGQEGARRHATKFFKAGAKEAHIPELPYLLVENHGRDLRDWLNEGHTYADLAKLAGAPITEEQTREWAGKSEDGRPRILVTPNESEIIDAAIEALPREQNLFQRGGIFVQVVTDAPPPRGIVRPKESPKIAPIKMARLQEIMSRTAYWERPAGESDAEPCHPPSWAVKGVEARGQWPAVPRLDGLAEVPVLRADGSVLQSPGFGVVADFPFAKPEHRATNIAAILTPLSRFAYHGPAPMNVIDASTRGTGKTLDIDLIGTVVSDREIPKMTYTRDDDELRKRITAIALSCEPLVLVDNVPDVVGSPSLDAALTASTWSDRVLGKTEMASGVPLHVTWYATGILP